MHNKKKGLIKTDKRKVEPAKKQSEILSFRLPKAAAEKIRKAARDKGITPAKFISEIITAEIMSYTDDQKRLDDAAAERLFLAMFKKICLLEAEVLKKHTKHDKYNKSLAEWHIHYENEKHKLWKYLYNDDTKYIDNYLHYEKLRAIYEDLNAEEEYREKM